LDSAGPEAGEDLLLCSAQTLCFITTGTATVSATAGCIAAFRESLQSGVAATEAIPLPPHNRLGGSINLQIRAEQGILNCSDFHTA
jgi:hypothetical protein